MSSPDPFWKRIWRTVRSQWLATTLLIPMGFLLINNQLANEAAREARAHTAQVERVAKLQESGKALDLALAGYFESIAQLGMAERDMKMPGAYASVEIPGAQRAVVEARSEARKALVEHASDVQSLRGALEPTDAASYMNALAAMRQTIDRDADISSTGQNITTLSKLVVARNELVDKAMDKAG